jgi:dTDP-4-dehydrorhamnose 3,5-epimerase
VSTELQFGLPLTCHTTPIAGFQRWDIPVHGDNRGWFKENWQRQKMIDLGLPDLGPVQNNISFNKSRGTTRGIHAEPWDKFISVATGSVFGAWVDLREGDGFGTVYTTVITPAVAVFVPRVVGNAFQTLEDSTAYSYLVNEHWSPDAEYTFLNLADETASIPWPVPLSEAELSDKDRQHPHLHDVTPMRFA